MLVVQNCENYFFDMKLKKAGSCRPATGFSIDRIRRFAKTGAYDVQVPLIPVGPEMAGDLCGLRVLCVSFF